MIIRIIPQEQSAKRVAAYARVSTLNEDQEESYETQVEYYTNYISHMHGWVFTKVYADKGLSGTSVAKRQGFMEMIHDAEQGEFDILLCKSISRFSRNYEDAQRYVHYLKGKGVEIRFEKEGLSTNDSQINIILGTMMAVAQQESKSLSENVRWSYERLGALGIRHVGSNHLLGYDEIDGNLEPNTDKWIIEMIFQCYAAGDTFGTIIQKLSEAGAKTLRKGKAFTISNLTYILRNEVYAGDRLMQKSPPTNYLTKKIDWSIARKQHYFHNHHTPIISRELWVAVQERLKSDHEDKQKGLKPRKDSHPFYGKIICGVCGSTYHRCVGVNRTEGRFFVWKCWNRTKGSCKGVIVRETEFESWFAAGADRVIVTEQGIAD